MVKKYIDKKKATTFHLVYRSQEDPLAFETGGSERVLVEANSNRKAKNKGKDVDHQTLAQGLADLGLDESDLHEAGEAALYGVYLDDRTYNYTKHLKPVGTAGGVLLEAPAAAKPKAKPRGIQFTDADADSEMQKEEVTSSNSKKSFGRGLELPVEVLPSDHRMDIKSDAFPVGPQPDMDPDVRDALEALDDDDVDELDDDFLDALNSDEPPPGFDEDKYNDNYFDDDDDDDFDPNDVFSQIQRMKASKKSAANYDSDDFDSDDDDNWRGSRTASTGFSMSSSAMFRNDKLTLLDDQFDQMEALYERDESDSESERYDEFGHGIPEYDSDGNPKPMSTRPDFNDVINDFLADYELTGKRLQVRLEGGDGAGKLSTYRTAFLNDTKDLDESKRDVIEAGKRIIDADNARDEKEDDRELESQFREKERTPWDCQTILTTYSTLDNHPALIKEENARIKVSRKTGFPIVLNADGSKQNQNGGNDNGDGKEDDDEEEEEERENKGVARKKDESKEEKRARKQALKEEKKTRREQKKSNREVFAEKRERKVQSKKDRAQYVVRLD